MFQNHLYERFAVISLPLKIATWILSSDTRLENNGLYLFKFFENKGPLLWFKLPQNTTEKFIMIFLLRKNQNVCCILCCFLEEEDKQSISWYQTKHNNYEQNNYEHTSQTTYLPVFRSLFFFFIHLYLYIHISSFKLAETRCIFWLLGRHLKPSKFTKKSMFFI